MLRPAAGAGERHAVVCVQLSGAPSYAAEAGMMPSSGLHNCAGVLAELLLTFRSGPHTAVFCAGVTDTGMWRSGCTDDGFEVAETAVCSLKLISRSSAFFARCCAWARPINLSRLADIPHINIRLSQHPQQAT